MKNASIVNIIHKKSERYELIIIFLAIIMPEPIVVVMPAPIELRIIFLPHPL